MFEFNDLFDCLILQKDERGTSLIEMMICGQKKSFQIHFANMTKVSLNDNRTTPVTRSLNAQSSKDGKLFSHVNDCKN